MTIIVIIISLIIGLLWFPIVLSHPLSPSYCLLYIIAPLCFRLFSFFSILAYDGAPTLYLFFVQQKKMEYKARADVLRDEFIEKRRRSFATLGEQAPNEQGVCLMSPVMNTSQRSFSAVRNQCGKKEGQETGSSVRMKTGVSSPKSSPPHPRFTSSSSSSSSCSSSSSSSPASSAMACGRAFEKVYQSDEIDDRECGDLRRRDRRRKARYSPYRSSRHYSTSLLDERCPLDADYYANASIVIAAKDNAKSSSNGRYYHSHQHSVNDNMDGEPSGHDSTAQLQSYSAFSPNRIQERSNDIDRNNNSTQHHSHGNTTIMNSSNNNRDNNSSSNNSNSNNRNSGVTFPPLQLNVSSSSWESLMPTPSTQRGMSSEGSSLVQDNLQLPSIRYCLRDVMAHEVWCLTCTITGVCLPK